MRIAIWAAGLAAGLGVATTALAQEHPALTAIRTLCLPVQGDPARTLAAADAAGWSPPPPMLPAAMARSLRLQQSAGRIHTFAANAATRTLPSGAIARTNTCYSRLRPVIGDVTADVQALMGRPPIAGAEWRYHDNAGKRVFLPDLSEETLEKALRDGPVTILFTRVDGEAAEVHVSIVFPPRR